MSTTTVGVKLTAELRDRLKTAAQSIERKRPSYTALQLKPPS